MLGAKFVLLVGVSMLAFVCAVVAYVVWSRMVGLDPTVAQWTNDLSRPVRLVLALALGAVLGAGSVAAPSVESGVAAAVLLAAAAVAGLLLFELTQQYAFD